jgi:hypothetical protein
MSKQQMKDVHWAANARVHRRAGGHVSKVVMCACLLGVLMVPGSAQSVPTGVVAPFEQASALIPAGNTCALHPEGNAAPEQTNTVSADEDGVVRFLALRATQPDSVARMMLDCTDGNGSMQTYSVDLRAEDTFRPRPFDGSLTTLTFRPALAGDPMSYTKQELLQAGYGLRPDPNLNPAGYQRWLAAASTPAYKVRSHRTATPPTTVRQDSAPAAHELPHDAKNNTGPNVYVQGSNYWTGARLQGSFQKGSTVAETYSYLVNEATFNVPKVYSVYSGGTATMTIWNGLDNVFQAIVDVQATGTSVVFGIHHQDIASPQKWIHCPTSSGPCTNPSNDNAGTTFTPAAGDTIWAQEWYCDAKGNENLLGGYACTYMTDETQGITWDCSQAKGSDCQSYALPAADLVNGNLGFWADYIIEDDTPHKGEWPVFAPVTMSGSAYVVKGNGTSGTGTWVTTSTDPYVLLLTDATPVTQRGNGHLIITLPTDAVKWTDVITNIYYWNGTAFGSFAPGCATSIGVGPNSHGLANGTPWITDCPAFYGGQDYSDGNHNVWQMQKDGFWVKMQDDVATQVSVSPEGEAWAINASGAILYWTGTGFAVNDAGGCARSIGVGPSSGLQTNGTPWIVGCKAGSDGNYDVYELQTGGTSDFHLSGWVKMQSDVATQIAVSPEGIPWAINASGQILHWNGSKFVVNTDAGCATAIAVGPNSSGQTNGTPWITRCTPDTTGNFAVDQLQSGSWVKLESGVGLGGYPMGAMAVSPDTGIGWVLSAPLVPPAKQAGSQWP